MLIVDILFALLMAFLLAALYYSGRRGRAGRWAIHLSLAVSGIFATWLAGVWLMPGEHMVWQFYWVSYVLLFPIWSVLAVMLLVRLPSLRPRGVRGNADTARSADAISALIFFSTVALLFVGLVLVRLL